MAGLKVTYQSHFGSILKTFGRIFFNKDATFVKSLITTWTLLIMKLIWFNPEDRSYHEGQKIDYEVQLSLSGLKSEFMIMHQFEEGMDHLAGKIVSRLNKAYQVY